MSKKTHTEKQWRDLCARYGNVCLLCGEAKPLTKDHVISRCVGGTDEIENIQPLCRECNSSKHAGTKDYRPDGLQGTPEYEHALLQHEYHKLLRENDGMRRRIWYLNMNQSNYTLNVQSLRRELQGSRDNNRKLKEKLAALKPAQQET